MKTWFDILDTREFPAPWEEVLQKRVAFYPLLSEADRRELQSYIRWFIGSKEFEGAGLESLMKFE